MKSKSLQKELNKVAVSRSEKDLRTVSDKLYEEFVSGRLSLAEIEAMAEQAKREAKAGRGRR